MNSKLKVMVTAVGLALGSISGGAHAGQTLFDVNGPLGTNTLGSDRLMLNQIVWNVGNLLAVQNRSGGNLAGSPTEGLLASATKLIGQGFFSSLSGGTISAAQQNLLNIGGAGTGNWELTYQFGLSVDQDSETDANGNAKPESMVWTDQASPAVNFFRIYLSTGNGVGGAKSNPEKGTGFGNSNEDGTEVVNVKDLLILDGTIQIDDPNTADTEAINFNRTGATPFPSPANSLDTANPDWSGGPGTTVGPVVGPVGSLPGSGSGAFFVKVTTQDFNYFMQPLGTIAFGLQMNLSGPTLPFPNEPIGPSDQILDRGLTDTAANVIRTYGSDTGPVKLNSGATVTAPINNYVCGTGNTCDFHMRDQGDLSILTDIPEPSALALLGLGLGVLGFASRRRLRAA